MTKQTKKASELLAQIVQTVERVAEEIETDPSKLTRNEWSACRRDDDPSYSDVKKVGGWAAVKRALDVAETARGAKEIVAAYREKNAATREKKEKKNLITRVAELERTLEVFMELQEQTLPPSPVHAPKPRRGSKRQGAVGLACSDWHIGQVISPAAVNHFNEFDLETARQRVRKLLQGFRWNLKMMRAGYEVNTLVLWLGGDLISGDIHDEIIETNELTPIEATLYTQELISNELIDPILEFGKFDRIIIPCNYGNHGRTRRRKQYKNAAQNSYEWGLYQSLRLRYKSEPKVEWNIAAGSHLYLDIYGQNVRFMHGDDVKFFGGIGGPLTPINKATMEWDKLKRADLNVYGHFHQYMSLQQHIQNGSLCGFDEFALAIKGSPEPPCQAMWLWDSVRGKRHSVPIWLDPSS